MNSLVCAETSGPSLLDGAGIVTEGRHAGRAMETGHAIRSGSQAIGSGGGETGHTGNGDVRAALQ